jgi:hypothetical protein
MQDPISKLISTRRIINARRITNARRAGGVVQVVEHLLSKLEALSFLWGRVVSPFPCQKKYVPLYVDITFCLSIHSLRT